MLAEITDIPVATPVARTWPREGEMMDTKGRKKVLTELDAERYELERKAGEREKQAQRLQGPQKNAAQLEARSLRQQAKEVVQRRMDIAKGKLQKKS
ncbi:MAG: hypothetical protein WCB10_20780 [Steroidobacteraceae bacterium]